MKKLMMIKFDGSFLNKKLPSNLIIIFLQVWVYNFLKCKLKLEETCEIKVHGVKISSKYNLYEYGKIFKSSEKSFCSESNS